MIFILYFFQVVWWSTLRRLVLIHQRVIPIPPKMERRRKTWVQLNLSWGRTPNRASHSDSQPVSYSSLPSRWCIHLNINVLTLDLGNYWHTLTTQWYDGEQQLAFLPQTHLRSTQRSKRLLRGWVSFEEEDQERWTQVRRDELSNVGLGHELMMELKKG